MSIELCFYYSSGEGKDSSAAPHMQLEIFWVTPHTAWIPSLLDLYLYIVSLTIYSSLSVNPCGLLQNKLNMPATSYSKMLQLLTEPELLQYKISIHAKWLS